MLKTVSDTRWGRAQTYEKIFWMRQAARPSAETRFAWYGEKAASVWRIARPLLGPQKSISILEIGSGPIGLVNYLPADELFSIDPLEDYYRTQPDFMAARDPKVIRFTGTGEDILSLDRKFSFVIIDNVLDHTKDPGKVLSAIHDSLFEKGVMYLSLNIYTDLGVLVRNVMELLQIDKGHPFNFSRQSVLALLVRNGFRVLVSNTEDYRVNKRRYRESGRPLLITKSLLGAVDYRFTAYCRKI